MMMEKGEIGFHPVVWLESLFKRIVEAEAGRGGIEAFCQYLDQIDFIPDLVPLRQSIKVNSIFFETALSKCSREQLRRPVQIREDEAFMFLGCTCIECGFKTTIRMRFTLKGKCMKCGGKLQPLYAKTLMDMVHNGMNPTPEAIIMDEAYNRLAEAYVAGYKALKLVMGETARLFGWEQFRIRDPQLRNYLDEYFLGRLVGETKIPREEKQILQFLARGSLARIDLEQAQQLIRLGMQVVKYGYIYEVLGVHGAHIHYTTALTTYITLYNRANEKIRTALSRISGETREPVVTVTSVENRYAPCFLMPRRCWESGDISKEINLEPFYRLPVFPKTDLGALQTVYGRLGSGKTFLLSSIACYSIRSKHEVVFTPLGDKSNSYTFACLPLFAYNRRTGGLVEVLKEILGVEPQGVPTVTLTFLKKDEKILDLEKHPPTIYDLVVEVEDPRGFDLPFRTVLGELKAVAEEYGFRRPVGIVNVRNLFRYDSRENVNIDVQVAANLLNKFDDWRKSNLTLPARVFIDEVSYLAPSQISLYAGDALRSGSTILDFIKESRRNRLSIDMATQMPLEILPNIRNAATNVFFRDLAVSSEKRRSQIDYLLDSLQLEDPTIKTVVRDINNRGLLGSGYWFWYHQPSRNIEVIKPSPPTFCLQDPDLTPRRVFKLYEKRTGEKTLLDSWEEVKRLKTVKTQEREPLR